MIFFWIFYYLSLSLICYSFSKIIKNKFINYFFIPIIFGVFGSIWFTHPGSNNLAPIISIIFLETSILNTNGLERLIRPMIGIIFVLEILSLILYFLNKRI